MCRILYCKLFCFKKDQSHKTDFLVPDKGFHKKSPFRSLHSASVFYTERSRTRGHWGRSSGSFSDKDNFYIRRGH